MRWKGIGSEEEGSALVRTVARTKVCDVAACGSEGYTLLHLAAHRGYSSMLQQLLRALEKTRDINVLDEDGYTPLYYAIQAER